MSAVPGQGPSTVGRPGRTPTQIRQDIELQRRQLGSSVEALRGRVNELTDWRGQLRAHERELRIAGAVAGFAIGGMLMLRRKRRR